MPEMLSELESQPQVRTMHADSWDNDTYEDFRLNGSPRDFIIVLHDRGVHSGYLWTREGVMIAQPGDFLVIGVLKHRYLCKPDVFVESHYPYTEGEDTNPGSEDGTQSKADIETMFETGVSSVMDDLAEMVENAGLYDASYDGNMALEVSAEEKAEVLEDLQAISTTFTSDPDEPEPEIPEVLIGHVQLVPSGEAGEVSHGALDPQSEKEFVQQLKQLDPFVLSCAIHRSIVSPNMSSGATYDWAMILSESAQYTAITDSIVNDESFGWKVITESEGACYPDTHVVTLSTPGSILYFAEGRSEELLTALIISSLVMAVRTGHIDFHDLREYVGDTQRYWDLMKMRAYGIPLSGVAS